MRPWVYACLCSLALGCGDDACVRRSDCASGLLCRAGVCVAPGGPSSDAADAGPADGPMDTPTDAPMDTTGTDGAGAPDAIQDSTPADAADAGLDGGTDA